MQGVLYLYEQSLRGAAGSKRWCMVLLGPSHHRLQVLRNSLLCLALDLPMPDCTATRTNTKRGDSVTRCDACAFARKAGRWIFQTQLGTWRHQRFSAYAVSRLIASASASAILYHKPTAYVCSGVATAIRW